MRKRQVDFLLAILDDEDPATWFIRERCASIVNSLEDTRERNR